MSGHDVGRASVVSTGLIVGDSVGVASLTRCCGAIEGVMSFVRLVCMLSNIEGGVIFVKRRLGVHGFTRCCISIGWAVNNSS